MRLIKCLLIGLLVVGMLGSVRAETDAKRLPGYVDFDLKEVFGLTRPVVQVFVDRPLLRMASAVVRHEEPEVSELLSKIQLVRVQVFSIEGDQAKRLEQKASEMEKRLEKDGWSVVVRVREEDQAVNVLLKTVKDAIAGLLVFVIQQDEVVLVNIAGEIEPAMLARLGGDFNLDMEALSSIKLPEMKAAAVASEE
jgi:predicted RNA binding protein YcfA (HicA-like mRNA interferase family)